MTALGAVIILRVDTIIKHLPSVHTRDIDIEKHHERRRERTPGPAWKASAPGHPVIYRPGLLMHYLELGPDKIGPELAHILVAVPIEVRLTHGDEVVGRLGQSRGVGRTSSGTGRVGAGRDLSWYRLCSGLQPNPRASLKAMAPISSRGNTRPLTHDPLPHGIKTEVVLIYDPSFMVCPALSVWPTVVLGARHGRGMRSSFRPDCPCF